jgi:predicted enzyme related to lactoylglutathione lyase
MDSNTNSLNWFEIPVTDMPRAKHFYQVVFGIHMFDMEMGEMVMAGFPGEPGNGKASGALVKSQSHVPSMDGVVIYLNANPDMSDSLSRVEDMGGKILLPKTQISPEIGFMAFIQDTEGNKIGIHSQQ